MAKTDQVTSPPWYFCWGTGVTLLDLAYEEYCERDMHGNHNKHVEAYYTQLANTQTKARQR